MSLKKSIDTSIYALCGELHHLASEACAQGNPDVVHYLVECRRKLERMARQIENRTSTLK